MYKFSTLTDLLSYRSQEQADQIAYIFLQNNGIELARLSYRELESQARAIAVQLQSMKATGERALLLYPPGLDYIAAFFGCLYAKVVAVPAYPPSRQKVSRLMAIIKDAQATVALTTTSVLTSLKEQFSATPELASLHWLITDNPNNDEVLDWEEPIINSDTLAFLQYTSGSTATPKGIMVSHGNILYNESMIQEAFQHTQQSIVAGWLPPYHDMGLIGNILQPLYVGIPCILMSPMTFVQQPFQWLEAISRYKVNTSGGPNFGYDLCVRSISSEQKKLLDLSSWDLAFIGSEPIRAETLDQFAEAFEPCGFQREAFYPCYGLGEATLFVSGGAKTTSPVIQSFQKEALKHNQIVPTALEDRNTKKFVSCGQTVSDQKILIVDPNKLVPCLPEQVGEIWLSGSNITQGYWNQPEQTKSAFQAYLADTNASAASEPFFRTGDLGFFSNGELFVIGYLQDLIVLDGCSYYPHDIELTVQKTNPKLRLGCGVAFTIAVNGLEQLVVVQEIERHYRDVNLDRMVAAIRQSVAKEHGLQIYAVVLVKMGSILKTSSGKLQRHICRSQFLADNLNVVGKWIYNLNQISSDKSEIEASEVA
ncbi:MAG: fatty acyl-AMP ligase [Nostoc sp. ChiSLP02]|nr:fatty acyl-AMP ligase [Nostoc sp. DedSLP05]MDZ8103251.1 fatty acyl-AMP ligase [Nostoc sp. DedSLP01]MDZ8187698.1 fatty acyl-AMP ligase [Nostoc sp. ChiSLP02]